MTPPWSMITTVNSSLYKQFVSALNYSWYMLTYITCTRNQTDVISNNTFQTIYIITINIILWLNYNINLPWLTVPHHRLPLHWLDALNWSDYFLKIAHRTYISIYLDLRNICIQTGIAPPPHRSMVGVYKKIMICIAI